MKRLIIKYSSVYSNQLLIKKFVIKYIFYWSGVKLKPSLLAVLTLKIFSYILPLKKRIQAVKTKRRKIILWVATCKIKITTLQRRKGRNRICIAHLNTTEKKLSTVFGTTCFNHNFLFFFKSVCTKWIYFRFFLRALLVHKRQEQSL